MSDNALQKKKKLIEWLKEVWKRTKTRNIEQIKKIWRDTYPTDNASDNKRTCFEKLFLILILAVRFISLSNFAIFKEETKDNSNLIDFYTIFVATVLTLLLIFSPSYYLWKMLANVAAIYFIADIVCYLLCVILIDSLVPEHKLKSLNRSFLLSIVNFYSLNVCFAILYSSFGFVMKSGCIGQDVNGAFKLFYFSLVSFATLGYGDFIPGDDTTRFIVVTQLFVEFVFVLAVIPVLIGRLSQRLSRQSNLKER